MSPASKHPVFPTPSNLDIKIWRYMDFAKYVSLLVEGGLWFSRIDRLEDRFEGVPSRINRALRRHEFENVLGIPRTEVERMVYPAGADGRYREYSYVNCWHMNEVESAALWKLYARSGEAIAIQSTYARLHESLPTNIDTYEVVPAGAEFQNVGQTEIGTDEYGNRVLKRPSRISLGVVDYIDYDTDPMVPGLSESGTPYSIIDFPGLVPLKYKRKSYEHERELRAIVWNMPLLEPGGHEPGYFPSGIPNLAAGQMVKLPLEDLIENVYVAPTAPDYFYKVVASVTGRYGLEREPIRSSLADDPVR